MRKKFQNEVNFLSVNNFSLLDSDSKDYTTNEPILVFVFKKSATRELFTEWCERSH